MSKLKSSFFPFNFLIVLNIALFLFGCSSSYKADLEKYYSGNRSLHTNLSDSLLFFCKMNGRKITLKKSPYNGGSIYFNIFFTDGSSYEPIVFDSLFHRHDSNPGRTSEIIIPQSIIENFNKLSYTSIMSNSNEVYFAYKDITSTFARDVSYLCLYVTNQNVPNEKNLKKISSGVYITTHYMD